MLTADDLEKWISDEGEQPIDEETDPDCPIIRLSKEEKTRICLPWKQTLIVKLLGKNIGYHLLPGNKISEISTEISAIPIFPDFFGEIFDIFLTSKNPKKMLLKGFEPTKNA